MHLASASDWAQNWGPLISLIANIALVGVTAWYVCLTRSMAASAQASAEQSRIAAEATRASATAAEASLDVRFGVHPLTGSTVDEMLKSLKDLMQDGLGGDVDITPDILAKISTWQSIALTCLGATVTVHSLELTHTGVASPKSDATIRIVDGTAYVHAIPLKPAGRLPRLCHVGETVEFLVEDSPLKEGITDFQVRVSYSIGNGPIRKRATGWTSRRKDSESENDGPITLGIRGRELRPTRRPPP